MAKRTKLIVTLFVVCIIIFLGIGLCLITNERLDSVYDVKEEGYKIDNPISEKQNIASQDREKEETINYYMQMFKTENQVNTWNEVKDLNNNGIPEYSFINIGEDCGSCHYQWLRIFEDKKEIFHYETNHPSLIPLADGESFIVEEPHYAQDDSMCCPSGYTRMTYKWEGKIFKEQDKKTYIEVKK